MSKPLSELRFSLYPISSDSSTIARQAERNLKGAVENCEDFMKTTGVLDVEIDFIKKNLLQ